MKLAILHPCFFPYEGYYRIVDEVDHVIFLDDMAFTSKEWLNKTILDISGKPYFFRIPIKKGENVIQLTNTIECTKKWKKKFLRAIKSGYGHAPNFKTVYPLMEEIVSLPTAQLSSIAAYSVYRVHEYLHVQQGNRAPSSTKFTLSSVKYNNINTFIKEKITEICKHERASELICLPYMKYSMDPKELSKNRTRVRFMGMDDNKYSIINKLMYDKEV